MAHTNGASFNTLPASSPHVEYSHRLAIQEAESRRLHRQHIWIGNARLAVFLGILALVWETGKTTVPFAYWLIAVVLIFIGLGIWDRRIVRAKNRANRAASFYRRGLARIEDRWSGAGPSGEEFRNPDHLYADDLDLLGEGSLFQLLCVARTQMGKECLASWLLSPAAPEEARGRQAAVKELAAKLDFRETLATEGDSEEVRVDAQVLSRWAQEGKLLDYSRWWVAAAVLGALSVPALIYGFIGRWTPFLLLMVVNGSIAYGLRKQLAHMFNGLDQACKNLNVLPLLLQRIEQEHFDSVWMRRRQAALLTGGLRSSECIARLARLSELADSRRNMFVAVLDVPLLYSVQLAFALQRWKDRFSSGVAVWLDCVAEMEALASLAAYSFEHRQDPFPEFEAAEAVCFEGEALGHPLLPTESCVRNDVALCGENQVLLVSGSNMSGKSTLLRVAGINAVLAMMGAPVRARRLRLSPLALGAAMRISDSLQKGVSHFYAEISRIRQVVELSAKTHVLFLFDEILQGTNSHDRRVGAEGIVRALVLNRAIGMVTTHDLALTTLADIFPGRVRNVHFQEKLESGKLHFDYQLREGVVTTSNGIELMKSVGLDV